MKNIRLQLVFFFLLITTCHLNSGVKVDSNNYEFWQVLDSLKFEYITSNFNASQTTSGPLNNSFGFKLDSKCKLGRYYLISDKSRSPSLVGSCYVQFCNSPWYYSDEDQVLKGLIISSKDFPYLKGVPKIGTRIDSWINDYPKFDYQDETITLYRKKSMSLSIITEKGTITRVIIGEFFIGVDNLEFQKKVKEKLAFIYT